MNNKSWQSLRILNDGRSALWEEKKSVSVMEHAFYREMSVDCSRFFDSPHQQSRYNYLYIDLYTIFWFILPALKFHRDRLSRHVL